MSSSYPIRQYNNYGTFCVCSKEIVEDIKNIGGTERKSLTVSFPQIPQKYFSDFVRGLWDGDGCVLANHDTHRYGANIASGNKEFLEKLYSTIKTETGIVGGGIVRNSRAYYLSFSKNDAIKIRDFMYRNSPRLFLARKHAKFYSIEPSKILQHKDMLSFNEARGVVGKLGIKNSNHWVSFWKKNVRPKNIPFSPSKSYRNEGWVSWTDFLGSHS